MGCTHLNSTSVLRVLQRGRAKVILRIDVSTAVVNQVVQHSHVSSARGEVERRPSVNVGRPCVGAEPDECHELGQLAEGGETAQLGCHHSGVLGIGVVEVVPGFARICL
jgi:hypothetical protein